MVMIVRCEIDVYATVIFSMKTKQLVINITNSCRRIPDKFSTNGNNSLILNEFIDYVKRGSTKMNERRSNTHIKAGATEMPCE